uniref:protein ALP1-like n=1 Tax=Erigeron canadensis TaxID=72917 RepID=UPI001CB89213|nr:protein ALP1-like [Erigeron canadensis]
MSSSSSSSSFDSFGSEDYDDAVESAVVAAVTLAMRVAQEEEEEEEERPRFRRRVVLVRHRAEAQENLMRDYFADQPTYTPRQFRRRFRMHKGVIRLYGRTYLHRPTWTDLQRIYDMHERVHGFLGMIGSIDCMHWPWEMYPTAWRGTYTRGDIGRPSLILQAVASYDLWIWNAFFGPQGSRNDINVFESSPVLEDLISGLVPSASFYANGNFYERGYYLGDVIYPEYAIFIKTFTDPVDGKRKLFKKKQESARKGIERAFGVLKKGWKVLNHPAQYWDKVLMQDVIYACIILHNMMLEDDVKTTIRMNLLLYRAIGNK